MFSYIKGKLASKHADFVVVDNGGIGYKIFTALSTIESIGQPSEDVRLFTYMYIREDAMSLFGFLTNEELSMFELLISVSGIGPKAALAVLSAVSPSKFGLAVITDDVKALTRAQGVGNKMAQRIILELKDKIKKEQLVEINAGVDFRENPDGVGSRLNEAVSALMVLGYTPVEANRAVAAVYSEDMDLESVIKAALKGLVR